MDINCKHTSRKGIILAIAALRPQFGVNVADPCWELHYSLKCVEGGEMGGGKGCNMGASVLLL